MGKWHIQFKCNHPYEDMYWSGGSLGDLSIAKEYTKEDAIIELDELMEEFNGNGVNSELANNGCTGVKIVEVKY